MWISWAEPSASNLRNGKPVFKKNDENCLLINSLINFRSNVKTVVWRSVTFCDPLLSDAVGCRRMHRLNSLRILLRLLHWGEAGFSRKAWHALRVRSYQRITWSIMKHHEATRTLHNYVLLSIAGMRSMENSRKQGCGLQNSLTTTKCKTKRFYCLPPGNWNGFQQTAQIKALNEAPTTILGIQPIVHLKSCHILTEAAEQTVPQLFHNCSTEGKKRGRWGSPSGVGHWKQDQPLNEICHDLSNCEITWPWWLCVLDFSHLADSRSVSWSLAINQASFDLATNASRHRKDMEGPRVHFHFVPQPATLQAVARDPPRYSTDAPGCPRMPRTFSERFKMRRYAESWSSSSKMFQACNGNCFGWCSNNATDDASLGSAGPVLMLNLTQTHFLVSNCRDSQRSRRLENSGLLQRPLNGRNAAN